MALIRLGVRLGLACSINAIVPLTTGAATLVPLIDKYGFAASGILPATSGAGFSTNSVLPGTASETVPTPGATRSGLAMKSVAVGPAELKLARVSSLRVSVPCVLEAPTVSTHGALPGAVIPPYCGWPAAFLPRLPAAVTTVIPRSVTRLAASVSGSVQNDSRMAAPTDMLTIRMLYNAWLSATQFSAAMML